MKLTPTPEQAKSLLSTIERANEACNYISKMAWEAKTFAQYKLQKLLYYDVKKRFSLSAQVVIMCIIKVADAYKKDKKGMRRFRRHGSIAYDDRILSYHPNDVSIWTVAGRERIPFLAGERQRELLKTRKGETDLVYHNGKFYLNVVCEVDEPPPYMPNEYLGVDLGIINIATDSDGEVFSGGHLNGLRNRYAKIRKRLQTKKTRPTKRLLRKRKAKEHKFATNTNHIISKRLVAKAKGTGRGIALEDLSGIRSRITVKKAQRRQQHSWGFYQLRQFVEYKSKLAGVRMVLVDPRNTSRTCPVCGCVDKRNRPTQSTFSCISCGHAGPSDIIAARNISGRAAVNQPYAACVEAKGTVKTLHATSLLAIEAEHSCKLPALAGSS